VLHANGRQIQGEMKSESAESVRSNPAEEVASNEEQIMKDYAATCLVDVAENVKFAVDTLDHGICLGIK